VIAEGIETEEQLRTVTEMGCELAQGFLLGRPAPAEVIEGLLGGTTRGAAVILPAR
jgi:EAL domain-containing protein (putative c-di-GMP-specific phosphodiesterase class I)